MSRPEEAEADVDPPASDQPAASRRSEAVPTARTSRASSSGRKVRAARKKPRIRPDEPPPVLLEAEEPERRPRRALVGGAALLIVGLGLVGIAPSDAGMALTLLGLATLIYGVHAFGRLGPPGLD